MPSDQGTQEMTGRCQKRECSMNGVDDTTRDAVTIIRLSSWSRKKINRSKCVEIGKHVEIWYKISMAIHLSS